MKLLYDENISRRLVTSLADAFPDSAHVVAVDLGEADDRAIWSFAREHEFVIVSKDSDFSDLSFLYGAPPKAAWLRIGNASTTRIATVLRANAERLRSFATSESESFIVLSGEGVTDAR